MPKKSEIVKVLQKLTKTEPQGDDESRQEFLERLASNSNEHFEKEEEAWEKQSDATQGWLNAAVKAIDAGKDIDDPDDAGEDAEDEQEDAADHDDDGEHEDEEAEVSTATKEKPKKKVAAKKEAKVTKEAKPAKKVKVAKKKLSPPKKGNGAVRGTGAQTVIKQLMLKDPNISTEDLIEKLDKKGMKPTKVAVTSIRSGMRHTMRVMHEAGVLHSSIKLGKEKEA